MQFTKEIDTICLIDRRCIVFFSTLKLTTTALTLAMVQFFFSYFSLVPARLWNYSINMKRVRWNTDYDLIYAAN